MHVNTASGARNMFAYLHICIDILVIECHEANSYKVMEYHGANSLMECHGANSLVIEYHGANSYIVMKYHGLTPSNGIPWG